jgi:hypothetical protein
MALKRDLICCIQIDWISSLTGILGDIWKPWTRNDGGSDDTDVAAVLVLNRDPDPVVAVDVLVTDAGGPCSEDNVREAMKDGVVGMRARRFLMRSKYDLELETARS